MNNVIKFHVLSCIFNLLIIILVGEINLFIVDLFDPMIFIKRGGSFDFIWVVYIFGLFWAFTFIIYVLKKPSLHLYLFFIIGFIVMLLKVLINVYHTGSDFFLFFINGLSETMVLIILSSIGIHFSQLLIGKKIIPLLYKVQ